MLLDKGKGPGGRPLLKPETVAKMTSVHFKPPKPGDKVGFSPGLGMGLGVQVVMTPTEVTEALSPGSFGHGGAHGTQAWADPVTGCLLRADDPAAGLRQRRPVGRAPGAAEAGVGRADPVDGGAGQRCRSAAVAAASFPPCPGPRLRHCSGGDDHAPPGSCVCLACVSPSAVSRPRVTAAAARTGSGGSGGQRRGAGRLLGGQRRQQLDRGQRRQLDCGQRRLVGGQRRQRRRFGRQWRQRRLAGHRRQRRLSDAGKPEAARPRPMAALPWIPIPGWARPSATA